MYIFVNNTCSANFDSFQTDIRQMAYNKSMVKADTPNEASEKVAPKTPAKKAEAPAPAHVTPEKPVNDSGLPLVSMILGIVSLVTFMVFLGIPAIVLGIIGLKKYPTSNRAFSITGIITGIISTLLMILFTIFLVFAVLVGLSEASSSPSTPESDGWHDTYDEGSDTPSRFDRNREGV